MNRPTSPRLARLLEYLFVTGAVVDGLAAVMLLSPTLTGAFFGRAPHAPDADLHLMMGYAASLMAGWTALLAWAAFDPVKRAFVGPLTAAPVLVGLAASEALALASGLVDHLRVLPTMSLQFLAAGGFLLLYKAVRRERDET
jgi:hypothetical protein